MNRILFEADEIRDGRATFGGVRAAHVLEVLHGEVGQTLKTGVVNGSVGTSEIVAIRGAGETAEIEVTVRHESAALAPWIDLVLAPPRPRVFKRLLPQMAALGVRQIILVGAEKVEKDFWGATVLKEENYRPLLVDGLMQAGTTALPTLAVWKSFRRFLREGVSALPDGCRVVAHPYEATGAMRSPVRRPEAFPVLAVGPEGGWTDGEVAALEEKGFGRYSLGPRILRTDTAVVALLAQLQLVMGADA